MEKKKVLIRVKASTADKLEKFSLFKGISKSEYVGALVEFMDLLKFYNDKDFQEKASELLDQAFLEALTPDTDQGGWVGDTEWSENFGVKITSDLDIEEKIKGAYIVAGIPTRDKATDRAMRDLILLALKDNVQPANLKKEIELVGDDWRSRQKK